MPQDWICKRCFHSTSTKSNLLSHLRNKTPCSVDTKDGGLDIPIQTFIDELLEPKQPKKFSCPHCQSLFSYNQSMNRHIKSCNKNPTNNNDDIIDTNNNVIAHENTNNTLVDNQLQQTLIEQRQLIEFLTQENQLLKSKIVQVSFNIINSNVPRTNKQKKKSIPHAVKVSCWNTHVGELIPKINCLCCNNVSITQHNFHCGHIIAESKGGTLEINNLLPICNVCNSSMGSTNMNEFKTMFGF